MIIIINKRTVYIKQDDEKYELKEGDLLLLEPGRKHKGYDYSDKGTSFYWVHFYCNELYNISNRIDIKSEISMTQNISLQNVAYEFNFLKEYLARYFKKRMGMSMQEYINYLRISNAKQLLCNSDLNIKEIAH